MKPYSSETPLPRVKEDIDRIKRLCWAYQCEEPWTLNSKGVEKEELDRLIIDKLGAGRQTDFVDHFFIVVLLVL